MASLKDFEKAEKEQPPKTEKEILEEKVALIVQEIRVNQASAERLTALYGAGRQPIVARSGHILDNRRRYSPSLMTNTAPSNSSNERENRIAYAVQQIYDAAKQAVAGKIGRQEAEKIIWLQVHASGGSEEKYLKYKEELEKGTVTKRGRIYDALSECLKEIGALPDAVIGQKNTYVITEENTDISSLTPMQNAVFFFIKNFIQEKKYSPSFEDIARGLNKSKSTVRAHLEKLKENGFITWGYRVGNSFQILKK